MILEETQYVIEIFLNKEDDMPSEYVHSVE